MRRQSIQNASLAFAFCGTFRENAPLTNVNLWRFEMNTIRYRARRSLTGGLVLAALSLTSAGSVLAQQQNDGCKAPQQQQQQQQTKKENDQEAVANGVDSSKLANCSGVLQPPSTGDSGMVAPAPEDGKTPVIPPGDAKNGQPESK
jgi:hypothetical protein